MKVVIALDSFKGSMSSLEAGCAVAVGLKRADPEVTTVVRPLADGGEGTVDALMEGMGGERQELLVTGPLGNPVRCIYGMIKEKRTAVIEMSGAAGITLVPQGKRNPLLATTFGVGEVIRDAIIKGCRRFLVGIGGSATNDGGVGMLQALGYEFLDRDGRQIPFGAQGLSELVRISDEHVIPELKECEFVIACDVTNPLCGSNGCSAVYGPQKGATPSLVKDMDQWLGHYAAVSKKKYPKADPAYPGTGAAGGLGFAFLTFTNASLQSGIKMILDEISLEQDIKDADLVITGEGKLDAQTTMGKAPTGVAKLAKKYGKIVIAFAGEVTEEAMECNRNGIDAFFSIVKGVTTLEQALDCDNAKNHLADTAEQVMRLIHTIIKSRYNMEGANVVRGTSDRR